LGPKVSQRFARKSSQSKQTNAKKPMKKRSNKARNKVLGQNTKKGSQKQLEHPLTLNVHLHGKHLCLLHPIGKKTTQTRHPKP
jgi:hypothetical protein